MSIVKRFTRNTAGRDLIVGDIHGAFCKLQLALDRVGFDPECDRLFSVGDLVDRGPESEQAEEWIARPWFHAVQGNHEDMAIRWPNGNMDARNYSANGGSWNVFRTRAEQVATADALSVLPVAIEIETSAGTVGVVHAECPMASWLDFTQALENRMLSHRRREQLIDVAQWSRRRIDDGDGSRVRDVRAVVVGHTPLTEPAVLGNVYYIDTGGWIGVSGGVRDFTLLDAETLRPVKARMSEAAS